MATSSTSDFKATNVSNYICNSEPLLSVSSRVLPNNRKNSKDEVAVTRLKMRGFDLFEMMITKSGVERLRTQANVYGPFFKFMNTNYAATGFDVNKLTGDNQHMTDAFCDILKNEVQECATTTIGMTKIKKDLCTARAHNTEIDFVETKFVIGSDVHIDPDYNWDGKGFSPNMSLTQIFEDIRQAWTQFLFTKLLELEDRGRTNDVLSALKNSAVYLSDIGRQIVASHCTGSMEMLIRMIPYALNPGDVDDETKGNVFWIAMTVGLNPYKGKGILFTKYTDPPKPRPKPNFVELSDYNPEDNWI